MVRVVSSPRKAKFLTFAAFINGSQSAYLFARLALHSMHIVDPLSLLENHILIASPSFHEIKPNLGSYSYPIPFTHLVTSSENSLLRLLHSPDQY